MRHLSTREGMTAILDYRTSSLSAFQGQCPKGISIKNYNLKKLAECVSKVVAVAIMEGEVV